MRQPWLYFWYRFDASIVNSLTQWIPHVSRHSVFSDDYKEYRDSLFGDDLWISSDIAFVIIPCVSHDFFFYRFDASVVNSFTLWIPHVSCHSVLNDDFLSYSDSVFADKLWISSDIAFLTIRYVNHYSIFAIDLMGRSWIHWHCRFHTVAVTQFSVTISSSTVTMFSLTIYGSAVT